MAKATALARESEALAKMRVGLREGLLSSPLCDAPRFARNFEDGMRGMWQKWCGQQQSTAAADQVRMTT
ncbi:MAG: hypothetical protein GC183_15575 [Thiobacillus sp.]|nr:hypothetical protein [Thiobacillus sp.]